MRRVFTPADAAEIAAAPYVRRALERDAVRSAVQAREAERARGTSAHLEPRAERPPEALEAEGLAAWRRAVRFAESPHGRFLAALRALEPAHPAETETVRAAFARGFAGPGETCVAEIGRALAVLARLDGDPARAACLALAEILTTGVRIAAE